jgi:transposase
MGIKICSASIIRAERECFRNLEEFENVVREKLITSPVIHFDETGMKIKGKNTGFMWLLMTNTPFI